MPPDALRDSDNPGLQSFHPDRLAYGGTIEVPDNSHRDRLPTWSNRLLYAALTAFVLAVVYGWIAVTP